MAAQLLQHLLLFNFIIKNVQNCRPKIKNNSWSKVNIYLLWVFEYFTQEKLYFSKQHFFPRGV